MTYTRKDWVLVSVVILQYFIQTGLKISRNVWKSIPRITGYRLDIWRCRLPYIYLEHFSVLYARNVAKDTFPRQIRVAIGTLLSVICEATTYTDSTFLYKTHLTCVDNCR